MNLDAFGHVIGIRPVTEPFKIDFKTYWRCHFPGAQYLGPYSTLVDVSGRGTNGRKARKDFAHRIRGRTLLTHPGTTQERQFPVPTNLTE